MPLFAKFHILENSCPNFRTFFVFFGKILRIFYQNVQQFSIFISVISIIFCPQPTFPEIKTFTTLPKFLPKLPALLMTVCLTFYSVTISDGLPPPPMPNMGASHRQALNADEPLPPPPPASGNVASQGNLYNNGHSAATEWVPPAYLERCEFFGCVLDKRSFVIN